MRFRRPCKTCISPEQNTETTHFSSHTHTHLDLEIWAVAKTRLTAVTMRRAHMARLRPRDLVRNSATLRMRQAFSKFFARVGLAGASSIARQSQRTYCALGALLKSQSIRPPVRSRYCGMTLFAAPTNRMSLSHNQARQTLRDIEFVRGSPRFAEILRTCLSAGWV